MIWASMHDLMTGLLYYDVLKFISLLVLLLVLFYSAFLDVKAIPDGL